VLTDDQGISAVGWVGLSTTWSRDRRRDERGCDRTAAERARIPGVLV